MAENMSSHESKMYVAPNPETHFDELFRVVQNNDSNIKLNGQNQQNNVPMRQRNFPESFFRPPSCSSSTSHSRESSLDATSMNSNFVNKNNNNNNCSNNINNNTALKPPNPMNQTQRNNNNNNNNNNNHVSPPLPPFVHQKAHSLPASLANQKFISTSMTNFDNNNAIIMTQPPHPQQQQQQQRFRQLKLSNHNITHNNNNNFHCRQQSYDIDKIPLPDGWTMSVDSSGQRYFIDHKNKITTWDDPRIKITQQNFNNLAQTSNNSIVNQSVVYPQQQTIQQTTQSLTQNNNNNNNNNNITIQQQPFYGSTDGTMHFTSIPDSGLVYNSNIPTEIQSVTEKMKGQMLTDNINQRINHQQQTFDQQNQYLNKLKLEREKMRNRAEILKSNPMVRSDYIPSLNVKDFTNITFITPTTTTTTATLMNGRRENQDSNLGSGNVNATLNNINFQNEANLLNDFSSNGHVVETSGQHDSNVVQYFMSDSGDLPSITDLDLDGLDFEQYLQHNPINNDIGQLFNYDETMTWNV